MKYRHWAQIGEVTFVAGIKLLFTAHRIIGRGPFRVLVYPVVLVYLLRHPLARTSSRAYLSRVFRLVHQEERRVLFWHSLRHFAAFAESILDKLRIWTGELRPSDIVMHGHNVIDEQSAVGRGGVIIVTHLGNVELCRALGTWRPNAAFTVLVHTKHARSFNALLTELNPSSSLNLLEVTEISINTIISLRERIDRGEYVVIAGDRVPVSDRPRVASAEFLGAPASFPIGPYVLASLLQCPSFLLFSISEGGSYHIYFERFRERIALERSSREATFHHLAADYAARLTHYCRLAPFQWFNFYDFWALADAGSADSLH